MKPNLKTAVKAIDDYGLCLTYPDSNKADPKSLWHVFHPRSKMEWDWDADSDDRIADMWIFREELSRSGKVVYAKWYKGKATFLSKELFPYYLAALNDFERSASGLSVEARRILEALEESSPLSTKQIKKQTDLQGKFWETTYNRAMKSLWERLLIVGWGEKDDGAFPSLNVASSKLFFEEEWKAAQSLNANKAVAMVAAKLKSSPSALQYFTKLARSFKN
jgi:hypothetical protein